MFTFCQQEFWKYAERYPIELRGAVTAFAIEHPPVECSPRLNVKDFEDAFFNGLSVAFEWQKFYSDLHDDDLLMRLIRLLRGLMK